MAEGLAGADGRLIGGRYRLAAAIGHGAMGTVWRAWDELLRRTVAVKEVRLPAWLSEAERDDLCQRTLREARTAARLSHPAVAAVHDVVGEQGRPWIIMEFVYGRPLDRVIKTSGPLSPKCAAEMGQQLLAALAAAHSAGVLHRDVKPGNVLLTGDGGAVLTDFGIATIDGDPSLTQAGMVMGTPVPGGSECRRLGNPARYRHLHRHRQPAMDGARLICDRSAQERASCREKDSCREDSGAPGPHGWARQRPAQGRRGRVAGRVVAVTAAVSSDPGAGRRRFWRGSGRWPTGPVTGRCHSGRAYRPRGWPARAVPSLHARYALLSD